ncbi:MAG: S-methyl-5-thioribose-1-phosphate isomerase, partial [Candidatus Cloacimonetes bacterium]|nr:S-methyl-5-thioribose-1-phosphate isomerase [Candidatus Cloacimonadota bacterium]
RPTAVDLSIGVQFVYESALKFIPDLPHARQVAVLAAQEFANKSADDCLKLGKIGAELIEDGARILTHCNAGALATVDHGTALSVIREAHKQGKNIFVYVSETRPRFQGARLTAFELEQEGIPHAIIADSAAGFYFWKEQIDLVITGADRICLNGDIANKIGTYEKAVMAAVHKVPFYIAAPDSTFDLTCAQGEDIPIEIRAEDEIKLFNGSYLANPGSPALNPSFDITPAQYITGIITPKGVFSPQEAAQRMQS